MLFLTPYDIIARLRKRLKLTQRNLLRFDDEKIFNKDDSVIEPTALVEMIDELLHLGYEFIGGFTDKGMAKIVNAYVNVKEWLSKQREKVGFRNLYAVFLYRCLPPSGVLMLNESILAYFPGIMSPHEALPIKVVGISREEKLKINEVCKRHKLEWCGNPSSPVLYRICNPSVENIKKFHTDILKFFEEAGCAEI